MRDESFKDQVAIITGAGIGIGFEIAKQLALKGACVILNDIDTNLAQDAAQSIREMGGACQAVSGDSSDLACIHEMIEQALSSFGKLDMAICNAGITTYGHFLEYPVEQFQRLMAVNLQGSFFLAQQAALQMIRQKSNGRIVLMSSVTGHQAHPDLTAYGMTKAALEMLAKGLGVELAAHGITVNAVAPGATLTERTMSQDNFRPIWERITPTGKAATTADIAHAALFLLSLHSSQITGQTIIVDGGWTSVSPPPVE